MSVAFTEQQVRARTKTVTRRKGWWMNSQCRRLVVPGDHLTLCRKVMGRKPGEPLVRICEVEVIDVRLEPLLLVAAPGELAAEGFPELDGTEDGAHEFIRRYFWPQRLGGTDDVTRIEWRYPSPEGDKAHE